MSDKYIENIAEQSYKNSIQHVPHTDVNKAWYEEMGTVAPRVEADRVWMDSAYIPNDPTQVTFTDDLYYATINKSSVAVVKKYTDLQLSKVSGTLATYANDELKDMILGDAYIPTIKDANGDSIPFGLNKWAVDESNGNLSFTEGFPSGFTSPITISFYRYVGRKITEAIITTDGSVPMMDEYVPEKKQDVATKVYVDDQVATVSDVVGKIAPPVPDTFEGKDLTLICDKAFSAYDVSSGDLMSKVVLPSWSFTVDLPKFYNPGYGTVSLLITSQNITYTYKSIDLASIDTTAFNITYNGDAYADTLASRGFYNAIKMQFDTSFDALPIIYSAGAAFKFQFKYGYKSTSYVSNILEIGKEEEQITSSFKSGNFALAPVDGYALRWVSGVPTPTAGSQIKVTGTSYRTLQYYKSNEKIADLTAFEASSDVLPDNSYGTYYPLGAFNSTISIPESCYAEQLIVTGKTYDIFGVQNGTHSETYNYRTDTVSDESGRVTSGTEAIETITDAGNAWDATADLTDANELQMLNGQYQWPTKDFSVNSTQISSITQFTFDTNFIAAGPDYSKCSQAGVRYVTFEHDMSIANGVYISIDNADNLTQDSQTKAYEVDSMLICVSGKTKWLDAKEAYDGTGTVSEWKQGCLSALNSKDGKIYCTFGPKPLTGKLLIRIGIKYSSGIKFSGVTVKENI